MLIQVSVMLFLQMRITGAFRTVLNKRPGF